MASGTASVIEDLIKGELNWHEKINNNMHKLNDRLSEAASAVSEAASAASEAKSAVTEMSGKLKADTTATKGSTNLVTSGAAYNLTEFNYSQGSKSSGNYQSLTNYVRPSAFGAAVVSQFEEYVNSSGKIRHRTMSGNVYPSNGVININSNYVLESDNTDSSCVNESSSLTMQGSSISMHLERDGSASAGLNFMLGYTAPQSNGIYDLGCTNCKFRNIYASTGTIQTSDANEKKNINAVDAELASKIIMGLNPVSFKFIDGTSDRTHYGLIAQEVEELVNGFGIDNKDFAALIKSQKTVRKVEKRPIGKDDNGETKYIEEYVDEPVEGEYVYGLRYDEFTAILVKMCQMLQEEVDELKSEVAALKNN